MSGASPAQLRAAHADAVRMHVGWAIVWLDIWQHAKPKLRYKNVEQYLLAAGFTYEWQHYAERLYRLKPR